MPFSPGDNGLWQSASGDFDFNIDFEQLFLSIIPSSLFIVSSLWRAALQVRKPKVIDAPVFQLIKLGVITTYVGLELAQLILVAMGSMRGVSALFIAASVLKLVAALLMVIVSMLDHCKSIRPSVLLSGYLFLTLLLDGAQARTLFMLASRGNDDNDDNHNARPELAYSALFTAALALKLVILVLEAQHKRSRGPAGGWDGHEKEEEKKKKERSPEETSGLFSLGVFFWLNGLFFRGYSKVLRLADLYPLDTALDADVLHDKFARHSVLSSMACHGHGEEENDDDIIDGSSDSNDQEGEQNDDVGQDRRHALLKHLIRALWVPLLLPVPPRLALLGFTICQPFFIETLLEHLDRPAVEDHIGSGLIGASVLIYTGIAVSKALCWYFHRRMQAMMRAILVTEIYIKSTQAQIGGGGGKGAKKGVLARDDDVHNNISNNGGEKDNSDNNNIEDSAALTLMSTDMERIDLGFHYLHDLWAGVVQAGLAAWMLQRQLGIVFLAPMALVTLCFAGLAVLVRYTGDSQRAWMAQSQRRVGLTATVIASIKSIKLSGLAGPVGDCVRSLRASELAAASLFRKIYLWSAVFGVVPFLYNAPLAFAFARLGGVGGGGGGGGGGGDDDDGNNDGGNSGGSLDSRAMFTSLAYILLLTDPLTIIFQTMPLFVSALACVGRIQAFLMRRDRHDYRRVRTDDDNDDKQKQLQGRRHVGPIQEKKAPLTADALQTSPEDVIIMERASFGWQPDRPVLRDLNLRVCRSRLTMIIGPVGSGKSSLCKALLGEMPWTNTGGGGSVSLSTRMPHVGFCDQTPFLCNASVRDNIVGFSAFDPQRYAEVIRATALELDLETLPHGDLSNIGSNGITLSGGQRQRVSLARALYLQTELVVLDDVLMGLDADTEECVFHRVFGLGGLLRRRQSTVVLCTHSIRHLPAADHIVVVDQGSIAEQGTFEHLMGHKDGYVYRLGLGSRRPSPSSSDSPSGNNSVSINSNSSSPAPVDSIKLAGAGSKEIAAATDQVFFTSITSSKEVPVSLATEGEAEHGDTARQIGDKTVYLHYIKSIGTPVAVASFVLAGGYGCSTNFATIWLKFWSDDTHERSHTYAFYAGVYALLQSCAMALLFLLGVTVLIVTMRRAGTRLHSDMIGTLVRAPLGFLTNTDTGVITNLFSQDLNLVDTELPSAIMNTLMSVSLAICSSAVMLSATPYMGIGYPFLFGLLWVVQMFYLRTSRQLRLLDLETKSPLYTHFLDTINGLATLRACGFMFLDISKNAALLNASQRPAYLLAMVQQWLTLVLDMVVTVMAVVMTSMAVKMHSNSGFTGAALVALMTFGEKLSGIVIHYTKLETSIGAVARLRAFHEDVKPEGAGRLGEEEDFVPPEEWPVLGGIELSGVCASYDKPDEQATARTPNLALRDIALSIRPGEKVAVCGRTGSGKSSLVALLLKLLDPVTPPSHPPPCQPGDTTDPLIVTTSSRPMMATIDGVPLSRIDRQALRERIIAVPQDAVFLPDGTSFRENLDPWGASTPEECREVLETVGLWSLVEQYQQQQQNGSGGSPGGGNSNSRAGGGGGGLEAGMSASASSAGQKQLLSLGRALIRRRVRCHRGGGSGGGILLLDEVSSSVDQHTERVMQDIIRREFRDYTVVAVSHRLEMIMDFDRVVVMDGGAIVESGCPRELAGDPATRFGELVRASAAGKNGDEKDHN